MVIYKNKYVKMLLGHSFIQYINSDPQLKIEMVTTEDRNEIRISKQSEGIDKNFSSALSNLSIKISQEWRLDMYLITSRGTFRFYSSPCSSGESAAKLAQLQKQSFDSYAEIIGHTVIMTIGQRRIL